MQSPPFPRYPVPPRPKYSPRHHILKHPQLPFILQCQRPSFTPTQNGITFPFYFYLTVNKCSCHFKFICSSKQPVQMDAGICESVGLLKFIYVGGSQVGEFLIKWNRNKPTFSYPVQHYFCVTRKIRLWRRLRSHECENTWPRPKSTSRWSRQKQITLTCYSKVTIVCIKVGRQRNAIAWNLSLSPCRDI